MASEAAERYVSQAGEGKSLMPGITLKTSANQTGGAFEFLELQGPLAPAPHVHREREEVFYVVEGSVEFTLGEDVVGAEERSVVLVPRGVRHAPKLGPGSRAVVMVVPAGLEGFFEELGAGLAAGKSQDEIRRALEGKYDSFADPRPPAQQFE